MPKDWTIRSMEESDTELAAEAAKRAKRTVSAWLGEAIRAYVAAERTDNGGYEIMPPAGNHSAPALLSAPVSLRPGLRDLVDMARDLAANESRAAVLNEAREAVMKELRTYSGDAP